MPLNRDIQSVVNATFLADTHEHLIEESIRLRPADPTQLFPCNDWSYLLFHYASDDLLSAGMPIEDLRRFQGADADIDEKWRLAAEFWPRIKHTGYGRAVRLTIHELYGEDDLTAANYRQVHQKYLAGVSKGFYREILQSRARILSCQVNSLVDIFTQTEYPDLLLQDLSIVAMSTPPEVERLSRLAGIEASTLKQWHAVIDWYFDRFGRAAVAVKSQAAYNRRLDYQNVSSSSAAPLFERHARGERLGEQEMKALEDHLFRYCVAKAAEYKLPVKLHTGYYAGNWGMPLARVGQNPADLCPLLQDFREASFVLMHIGYPYQDEIISLAKHYPNANVDMCWSWIINPAASVRFLKEFLVAVPAHKVLTFGGDYITVETVVGHAAIARHGIARALTELVDEQWISVEDAVALIPFLMHGNAQRLFHLDEQGAKSTVR